jgi:hypothetical protein
MDERRHQDQETHNYVGWDAHGLRPYGQGERREAAAPGVELLSELTGCHPLVPLSGLGELRLQLATTGRIFADR